LFDRTWEKNFINDTQSGGVVCDREATPPNTAPRPSAMSFIGLTFADTSFRAVGYQEGFSVSSNSPGMPRDAAVVVSEGANILISGCTFNQLGGGGVHVTNGSFGITVSNSSFNHLGQSGVVFSGGAPAATQPTHCAVLNCAFTHVGEVLASAASVYFVHFR
jgi:hypothetical protein